jgi:PleD family two-component response regulator
MTSSARPPGHTTPAAAGTSVLVVEDDPGIATQLVRGLSRGGYAVDHVTTGHDALDRANPDVVLLDLGPARRRRRGHLPPAARAVRGRESSW